MEKKVSFLVILMAAIAAASIISGCSNALEPTDAGMVEAEFVPLHTEILENGNEIRFYEISAEPGMIVMLEGVKDGNAPVVGSSIDMSIEGIYASIGKEMPGILENPSARQQKYSMKNPLVQGEPSLAATRSLQDYADTDCSYETWKAKWLKELGNYKNSRRNLKIIGRDTGSFTVKRMEYAGRIIFRAKGMYAWVMIEYRRPFHKYHLSVDDDFSADGRTWVWTDPNSGNYNTDYHCWVSATEGNQVWVTAGFRD